MKKIQRMVSLLLVCCLFVSLLPASVQAAVVDSGTCGEDLTWTLDSDGTLTISGTGPIESWAAPSWDEMGDRIVAVSIGNGVTSIGAWAFAYCTSLTSVTIPDSVTSIGYEAFYKCTSLTSIVIPDSVTSIDIQAFVDCTSLTSVTILAGVTSVGDGAFRGCASLTSVTIPDGVTSIGYETFMYCTSLTSVTIPDSVTSIGKYAFCDCTSLTSVTIPDSVTSIGYKAFCKCTSLTSVTIPDGVTSIGDSAFSGCESLTSIVIPDSVTSIGDYAFYDCTSLTSVTIPDGVTSIGEGVFWACASLTSVAIPDSVTSIDYCAFYDCASLISVTIPNSVTSIGDYAFSGCGSLTSVMIPDSVTSIGSFAFLGCTSLPDITIPRSVTSISIDAFSSCTGLKEIYFCGKAPLLSDNVFGSVCATAYYPADDATWTSDVMQDYGGTVIWVSYSNQRPEEDSSKWKTAYRDLLIADKASGNLNLLIYGNWADAVDYELIYINNDEIPEIWITYAIAASAVESRLLSYSGGKTLNKLLGDVNLNYEKYSGKFHAQFAGSGIWSDTLYRLQDNDLEEVARGSYSMFGENGSIYEDFVYQWNGSTVTEYQYMEEISNWIDETAALTTGSEESTIYDYEGILEYLLQESTESDAEVKEYLNNSSIEINGAGSAYAYYICKPNQSICYTVNGKSGSVQSNDKGIIRVPLGTFTTPGSESVTVRITHIGDKELDKEYVFYSTVKVNSVEFSQSWEASLDASVGAALTAGASLELGIIEADATLGKTGAEAGDGSSMNISREFSNKGEILELTSNRKVGAGVKVTSGITGEALDAKLTIIEASGKIASDSSVTYGIKIDNYSAENSAQQKAIATYFLGEILLAKPNMIFLRGFHDKLAKSVYADSGCQVISGSAVELNGTLGADGGAIEVNGTDLFKAAGAEGKMAVSVSEKSSTNGSVEKSTSYKTETDLYLIAFKPDNGDVSIDLGGVLSKKFLGNDTSITAKKSLTDKTIEATSLDDSYSKVSSFILGKETTAVYNKYVFRNDALRGLLDSTSYFAAYLNENNMVLSTYDLAQMATTISHSNAPIEYSSQTKKQVLNTLPLGLGLGLGVELDFDVTLSYLEDTCFTTDVGYVIDDEILLTGESFKVGSQVEKNERELEEIFINVLQSLANDAANFFDKITSPIRNGVKNAGAWIAGKADSAHDWLVTIISVPHDDSATWSASTRVSVCNSNARNLTSDTLVDAATIGQPHVIGVTDAATNEAVTDLSGESLELTIRYTPEDMEAAGLSAKNGENLSGIAMYRYSDEGDFFEYVGGQHDLTAMTVTATITRTGQYVLATDTCAPQLTTLDISDFRSQPTITAMIDDLTGLDLNSFLFRLNGEVKVDGSNINDHYQKNAGIFTYTVPEESPLSEGENTMIFTLSDTTGNSETYKYSFNVDLTAPTILDVEVKGSTNAGSSLEIRAQVDDRNLKAVYAVLSKQFSDGTWSDDVKVEMSKVGEKLWGVNYEGDGSTVKVYILATDIAENSTSSEVYTCPSKDASISRLAGDNRFLTAIAVADQMKTEMNVEKFDAVIVASGTNFADALSGSYLAAVKNAPILLSCNEDFNPNLVDKYNTIVLDYIKENLNTNGTVYILGGPKAVAPVLDEALKGYKVKRLAGANRYATNIAILEEAGVVGKDVLICNGEGFADSLSASATELPILLVNSKYGLFDLQKPFLEGCDGKLYIIGGTSAVNNWVEGQLQKYGTIERIGGKNRFETSVLIAEKFFPNPDSAILAYGWNFPDGLCGGSLAAAIDAPLILTMDGREEKATEYTKEMSVSGGYVLGSASLVADDTVRTIFGLSQNTE